MDVTLVSDAAGRQQCSEYAIFADAYTHWFGQPASEAELARHFARFLARGDTPHWVRHYCRAYCTGAADGPAARRSHTAGRPISGMRCLAVGGYLLFCLTAACGVALLY